MSRPSLKLRFVPDSMLIMDCYQITKMDEDILYAMEEARRIMLENNGVGIAAPQVGVPLRFFLIGDRVFINPTIGNLSNDSDFAEESCLSIPDVSVSIERNTDILVTYFDVGMNKQKIKLTGMDARIALHELDHLNGVLITDESNWKQHKDIQFRNFDSEDVQSLQFWYKKVQ